MKYIDKFANLDDFLNSELQKMTGDRIATIDGYTLPILKKKLKTVITIDPSTNEEVETEEIQDVWMVPVGQEEKKVEHDFVFIIPKMNVYMEKAINTLTFSMYLSEDDLIKDNDVITSFFNEGIEVLSNTTTLEGFSYRIEKNNGNPPCWTLTIWPSAPITEDGVYTFSIPVTPIGSDKPFNVLLAVDLTLQRLETISIYESHERNIQLDNNNTAIDGQYWVINNQFLHYNDVQDSSVSYVPDNNEVYSYIVNGGNKVTDFIVTDSVYNTGGTMEGTIKVKGDLPKFGMKSGNSSSSSELVCQGSTDPENFFDIPFSVHLSVKKDMNDPFFNTFTFALEKDSQALVSDGTIGEQMSFEFDNFLNNADVNRLNNKNLTLADFTFKTSNSNISVTGTSSNSLAIAFNIPSDYAVGMHTENLKVYVQNAYGYRYREWNISFTFNAVAALPSLEYLELPEGTTSIDSMVLTSAYPNDIDRPREFAIPEGVTSIESEAFYGWTINNISFPSTLEFVGSRAFDLYLGQDTITSVTLPANCKYFDNSFGGTSYASFANMSSDPMTANTVWTPITVTGGQVYSCRLSDILTSEQKTTLKNGGFYSGIWMQLDPNYSTNIKQKVTIADFDNIWGPAPENPDPMMPNLYFGRGDMLLDTWEYLKEVHFPTYMTGEFGDNVFGSCRSLNTVTGIDNITSIGKNCFRNTNISSFTLPTSVTTIGQGAFSWEYLSTAPLTSFTIPQGSMLNKIEGNAFAGQNNLLSITLPAGCQYSASSFHNNTVVTGGIQGWDMHDQAHYGQIVEDNTVTVDSYKFNNNSSDFRYGVNYYFPSSVTTIGDFAFNNCQNLSNITLHSGITSIGANAFANCWSLAGTIALPSTLTTLGSSAFWNCSQLSVTFPLSWSVTSIPNDCFSGCGFNSSSSITIPDGVTSIGNNAFYNCSGLTSVTLPNSLTSVGSGAFAGTNLTAVTLPNGCTWYETSFPAGCTVTSDTAAMAVVADLTNYSASGSLSSDYFQMNFGNGVYSKVIIPEGVTELQTIGNVWFPYSTMNSIKEVTMPSTLTTVGSCAFMNMVNLETLDTQYLQSIPASLFQGDTKLFRNSAPTLNSHVTSIPENAFRGTMNNVTTLDLSASNIMSIGANAFAETGLTSVTLPSGCTYYLNSFPAGCTVTGGSLFTYDETDAYNETGVEIFPTGTTSISQDPLGMFYNAKQKMTSLTVPASIADIGSNVFNSYNNLNSLTFQHGSSDPLSISSYSFQLCDIRSLAIPAGCTNIQERAFADNNHLSSVTFDPSAAALSIGVEAFANTALASVTLPTAATYWPNSFPAGCTVTGGSVADMSLSISSMNSSMSFSYQSYWTKIYFQSDVTSTVINMFEHSTNILEVEFDNSGFLMLQSNMFKDCENLATVTFNGAAVSVSAGAFSGTALTAVTLPVDSTYETGAFPVGCTVNVQAPSGGEPAGEGGEPAGEGGDPA